MSSNYQRLIRKIDPAINPAGVEASMRLQYSTLDHLPHAEFVRETRLAAAMEREEPGCLAMIAKSYGMSAEFDEWESVG